ncbi:hypothetical protein IAT40_006581 [Kwoniella sp. CBS 6097]
MDPFQTIRTKDSECTSLKSVIESTASDGKAGRASLKTVSERGVWDQVYKPTAEPEFPKCSLCHIGKATCTQNSDPEVLVKLGKLVPYPVTKKGAPADKATYIAIRVPKATYAADSRPPPVNPETSNLLRSCSKPPKTSSSSEPGRRFVKDRWLRPRVGVGATSMTEEDLVGAKRFTLVHSTLVLAPGFLIPLDTSSNPQQIVHDPEPVVLPTEASATPVKDQSKHSSDDSGDD